MNPRLLTALTGLAAIASVSLFAGASEAKAPTRCVPVRSATARLYCHARAVITFARREYIFTHAPGIPSVCTLLNGQFDVTTTGKSIVTHGGGFRENIGFALFLGPNEPENNGRLVTGGGTYQGVAWVTTIRRDGKGVVRVHLASDLRAGTFRGVLPDRSKETCASSCSDPNTIYDPKSFGGALSGSFKCW